MSSTDRTSGEVDRKLAQLKRTILLRESFGLYFVAAEPALRSLVVQELLSWAATKGFALELLRRETTGELVDDLLGPLRGSPPRSGAILDVSNLFEEGEEALRRINTARDVLPRVVQGPLVLLLSVEEASTLHNLVPDLFDVRALPVIELKNKRKKRRRPRGTLNVELVDSCLVAVWDGEASGEHVERFNAHLDALSRMAGDQATVLFVWLPTSEAPNEEARRKLTIQFRKFPGRVFLVPEGEGFKLSLLRAVSAGLMLVAGRRGRFVVVESAEVAISMLCKGELASKPLVDALRRLRHLSVAGA